MKEPTLRILVVEPKKAPYTATIENTLEGMQAIVGGYIEYVPLQDGAVALYCNDEGKLEGLPCNRRIGNDIIAGTFFLCGSDGEQDISLTDEQLFQYSGRFAQPEFTAPSFVLKTASSTDELMDMLFGPGWTADNGEDELER